MKQNFGDLRTTNLDKEIAKRKIDKSEFWSRRSTKRVSAVDRLIIYIFGWLVNETYHRLGFNWLEDLECKHEADFTTSWWLVCEFSEMYSDICEAHACGWRKSAEIWDEKRDDENLFTRAP